MQLHRPLSCVTPTVDGDVLAVLARASAEFTAPQVHRAIGAHSVAGVRLVLARLAEQGIVNTRPAGRATLYSLNREHLAADAVIQLANLRDRLLTRISDAASQWTIPAELVMLFGSAAGSSMRPDSDIDLLVVRPADVGASDDAWRHQLASLEDAVSRWTGNDARVLEYGVNELTGPTPRGVIDDIVRTGIHITGNRAALLGIATAAAS